MKAIIVAAGEGKRIASITKGSPKCLLPVNGVPLIDRTIAQLSAAGIRDIGIVVGYKKEDIIAHLKTPVTYIENPEYQTTNNMASLFCAKTFVYNEAFVYVHADVIMDDSVLVKIMQQKGDIMLAIDAKPCDTEAMKVRVEKGHIVESSKEIPLDKSAGEWIGLISFSVNGGTAFFDEAQCVLKEKKYSMKYDTFVITRLARLGFPISLCDITGMPWVEIDFPEDFERAERLFR
jgi:choline kinase